MSAEVPAEVQHAVDGIPSKLTFKGAFFFALQPLANLCDPNSAQGAVNGLGAFYGGALDKLLPAFAKFAGDEQISRTIMKILESMVSQMVLVNDESAITQFVERGAFEAVVEYVSQFKGDPTDKTYASAMNLVNLLGTKQADKLPPHLTKKLTGAAVNSIGPNSTLASTNQIFELAQTAAKTADGARSIAETAGVQRILDFLNGGQVAKADVAEATKTIIKGLNIVDDCYKQSTANTEGIRSIMTLVDRFDHSPAIRARCVKLMQSMFTKDALKKTIQEIQREDISSQERNSALCVLLPMSYLPNLAGACVEDNGVNVLVKALQQVSSEPKCDTEALKGCCKMLGNVASMPASYTVVMEAGALDVCVDILKQNADPKVLAAILPLAAALVGGAAAADKFMASGAYDELIERYKANLKDEDFLLAAAAVLQALANHANVAQAMIKKGSVKAMAQMFEANTSCSQPLCEKTTRALAHMTQHVKNIEFDPTSFYSIYKKTCGKTTDYGPAVMRNLGEALGNVAKIPNATVKLNKDEVCEAAFAVLARVPINSVPYKRCVEALSVFADEATYKSAMETTKASLNGRDAKKTIGQLTVLSALGGVSRLSGVVQAGGADTILSDHIKKLALAPHSADRDAEANAAVQCLTNLFPISNGNTRSLKGLFEITQCSELQQDLNKNPGSQMNTNVLNGIKRSLDTGNIVDKSTLEVITKNTMTVLNTFPDDRKAQVLATEIVGSMLKKGGVTAANVMADMNIPSFLVGNSRKFKMWADLQVATFNALADLSTVPNDTPEVISQLQTSNIMDAIRSARVAHPRCEPLKKPLAVVSQRFMPEGYLEQQMVELLRALRVNVGNQDWSSVREDVGRLVSLANSPEGLRIAARNGAIPLLTDLLAAKNIDKEHSPAISRDAAHLLKLITASAAGSKAALKAGTAHQIQTKFVNLAKGNGDPNDVDVACNLMGALANIGYKDPKGVAPTILQVAAQTRTLMKTVSDPATSQRLNDSLMDMLMALPPEIRIGDATCEAVLEQIIKDLSSTNSEVAQRAAKRLQEWANNQVIIEDLVQKRRIPGKLYAALNTQAKTPAIVPFIKLLEALSLVPETLSDAEAKDRVNILTQLIVSSNDPTVIIPAMQVLARLIQTHSNPAVFENMPALHDTIRHAQGICADKKDLIADSITTILNAAGGEAAMISWLKHLSSLTETSALVEALGDSEIYMKTRIEKADLVLPIFDDVCAAIGQKLAEEPNNSELVVRLAQFTDQSAKADAKLHDASGREQMATSIADSLMDPLSHALMQELKKPEPSSDILVNGLEAFTALLINNDTRKPALELCENIASEAIAMMCRPDLSANLRGPVRNFLNALGDTDSGQRIIEQGIKDNSAQVGQLTNLQWAFKRLNTLDPATQVSDIEVECDYITNLLRESDAARKEFWDDPNYVQYIDAATTAESDLLAKKIAIMAAACGTEATPEREAALASRVRELKDLFESGDLTAEQKAECARRLATSLRLAGTDDTVQQILRRHRIPELLGDILAAAPRNSTTWKQCLPDVTEYAKICEQNGANAIDVIIPLMAQDSTYFERDPELKGHAASFLAALIKWPGLGYKLLQTPGFDSLLAALKAGLSPDSDLCHEFDEVLELCKTDEPRIITLQSVLARWAKVLGVEANEVPLPPSDKFAGENELTTSELKEKHAKHDRIVLKGGMMLTPTYCQEVADHIPFVFSEMSARSRSTQAETSLTSGNSMEVLAGLRCLGLLHLFPENHTDLEQREEDEIIAAGIMQEGSVLVQSYIETGYDLVLMVPSVTSSFASIPGFGPAMVQVIADGRNNASHDVEGSALLADRLYFLGKVIPHRQWLENTDIVRILINCWNDVDAGKFDDRVLYGVLRCLRTTVTPTAVDIILDNKIPERIKEIIEKRTVAWVGLADAFFLLGIMGTIGQFKTYVGDHGLVETTLKFVKDSMSFPYDHESSPALINAVLALGSLCVDHRANCDRFVANKGIDISVALIESIGQDKRGDSIPYDRANAAAVVLCNASYRRDDVKALYASAKAPKHIMSAIAGYSGAADDQAARCMSSMFKAVGNLVLYAPNIRIFVDNGIADVFKNFLRKASDFPGSVHEAGVRCLSNLLMENDEVALEALSAVVPYLTQDIGTKHGQGEVQIFVNALEALQFLARLERNGQAAIDENILQHCSSVAQATTSKAVLNGIISFLAVLARHDTLVKPVVDQGGIECIATVFDKEKEIGAVKSDLSQKCFIALRRLLAERSVAESFLEKGGGMSIGRMLVGRSEQLHTMAEGIKLMLNLLKMFPAPSAHDGQQQDESADWADEEPGNEGFLPVSLQLKRPPGPRAWEMLGLTPAMVNKIVMAVVQSLGGTNMAVVRKYLNQSLTLLGYFAHEKIVGCEAAFFNANFLPIGTNIVIENPGNLLYTDIVAGIGANMAVVADDDAFAVFSANDEFGTALLQSEKLIPKRYSVEKRYISNVAATALNPDSNQLSFWPYAAFDFDLDRVEVPATAGDEGEGVQGLPAPVKTRLREGGEFWLVTPENLRGVRHTWKASLDLLRLQWTEGQAATVFTNSVPILKCQGVKPGATSATLVAANRAHKISCAETHLASLPGLAEPALDVRFRTRTSRDSFTMLMRMWRDAAANIA